MIHRKQVHQTIQCLKFLKNLCYFSSEKCWYEHKGAKVINPENLIEMKEPAATEAEEPTAKPPVFRLPPGNLAPPAQETTPVMTQATWIKMMSMMSELKQMMEKAKQFQQ